MSGERVWRIAPVLALAALTAGCSQDEPDLVRIAQAFAAPDSLHKAAVARGRPRGQDTIPIATSLERDSVTWVQISGASWPYPSHEPVTFHCGGVVIDSTWFESHARAID
jgi:hypothetical protein